jgi:hypothetical protein
LTDHCASTSAKPARYSSISLDGVPGYAQATANPASYAPCARASFPESSFTEGDVSFAFNASPEKLGLLVPHYRECQIEGQCLQESGRSRETAGLKYSTAILNMKHYRHFISLFPGNPLDCPRKYMFYTRLAMQFSFRQAKMRIAQYSRKVFE